MDGYLILSNFWEPWSWVLKQPWLAVGGLSLLNHDMSLLQAVLFFPWLPICPTMMFLVLPRHIFWFCYAGFQTCITLRPKVSPGSIYLFWKNMDWGQGQNRKKKAGSTFAIKTCCWFNFKTQSVYEQNISFLKKKKGLGQGQTRKNNKQAVIVKTIQYPACLSWLPDITIQPL